jgi:hypothetical protein
MFRYSGREKYKKTENEIAKQSERGREEGRKR